MQKATILLSDREFDIIKSACRDRFNWTDGGHWNGRGKAPDCSVTRSKIQTSSLTVRWPDDDAADRWNADMARNDRLIGYGVGLLSSLVAAWLPGLGVLRGAPAHFRDFAITVVTGESLAKIAPKQVNKGESVKITMRMEYYEPASPLGRRSFTATATTEWFDDRGASLAGPFESVQHYSAASFPMDFAWRLVNQPPANLIQNY